MLVNPPVEERAKVTLTIYDYPEKVTEFLDGVKEVERLRKKVSDLTVEVDRLRTQITRRQEYNEHKKS